MSVRGWKCVWLRAGVHSMCVGVVVIWVYVVFVSVCCSYTLDRPCGQCGGVYVCVCVGWDGCAFGTTRASLVQSLNHERPSLHVHLCAMYLSRM